MWSALERCWRHVTAASYTECMITVHHLNNSRSQRVLWLLEELGLEYEVKRYQRDAKTMLAPAELKEVHPLGKSPVLTDDGKTLAESGAIVEYLVDTYGDGRLAPPRGTPERLRFTYWLHYAEGSAMPPLLLRLIFDRMESKAVPWLVRPVSKGIARTVKRTFLDAQIDTHLGFQDAELAKSAWFAGDEFSAADIQMSFPIEAANQRVGLASRPHLAAFLAAIRSRPAYAKALEVGGPYDL